jgi:hypothetical protein
MLTSFSNNDPERELRASFASGMQIKAEQHDLECSSGVQFIERAIMGGLGAHYRFQTYHTEEDEGGLSQVDFVCGSYYVSVLFDPDAEEGARFCFQYHLEGDNVRGCSAGSMAELIAAMHSMFQADEEFLVEGYSEAGVL